MPLLSRSPEGQRDHPRGGWADGDPGPAGRYRM